MKTDYREWQPGGVLKSTTGLSYMIIGMSVNNDLIELKETKSGSIWTGRPSQCDWIEGYRAPLELNKKNMAKIGEIAAVLLDADAKKLVEAGFVDQCTMELTPSGHAVLQGLTFAAYKADMLKKADEVIAERKNK